MKFKEAYLAVFVLRPVESPQHGPRERERARAREKGPTDKPYNTILQQEFLKHDS
jgi:hypothetical protein